eukprot:CAMPEP_0119213468 /NCGR_PEP_ID=MMETSP1327-20130426/6892_1 /TAXON_ID=38833 /ORGANISM="Micromonas pusilla, Strain RCC2306" /LENGTH=322 /DNA_ID=CAMNT_0007211057 /DNA_START=102 /DNA_END=1071 /DNA_ORIENTATION=+
MSRSKLSAKYGSFSNPAYLSAGEPYNDSDPMRSSRHYGLNMLAPGTKTGKGNKAVFDKFKPLFEKETYRGAMRAEERAARRDAKRAGIIQPVMKPASAVRSKTSGLGSYDGSLGGAFVHLPASGGGDGAKKVKGDYESAPRGITAKPGQKGSYGTRGTTISESHSKFGVANEFAHKTGDHYDAAESWKKNEGNEAKKKEQSNPFRPAALGKKGGPGVRGTTLGGPKGHGVCGEYAYVPQGPEVAEICSPPEKAWHVTKPNTGPINKPLRYLEDPQELKLAAAREALETEKERMAEKKAFVPMGAGRAKIGATRSVVRMGINR